MNSNAASPRPNHVCIVLLTAIGDVVHGLPVANALKRAWPETRITWVVEPGPAPMISPHRAVDQVILFEKRRGWRGVRALRQRMRGEHFDVTLNLMPYFKSNFPTLFSRAPVRWTFDRARARDGVWLLGNRRLPARPRQHTQDMFVEFIEALGLDPFPLEWHLAITDAERAEQRHFIDQLDGRRAVAVVPASSKAIKDWPAERFVPVVNAVQNDLGARAVLLGGPGEREIDAAHTIHAAADRPPLWMMGGPVRSLIWCIDACNLVVAPDTGPVHIARALETPVVGLYGHTNPYRVGPYRAWQDLWIDMYTEPDEAPDPSRFDPKHGRMERITPAMVISKVDQALRSY